MKTAPLPSKVILMYHSVASNKHPAVTGSYPISFSRFQAQIHLISAAGYRFERISRLHDSTKEKGKVAFITGDDGTIDWTRNVLPWCEKRKIPTHTGVITSPWEKNPTFPLAHCIQVILSTRQEHQLRAISKQLQTKFLNEQQIKYIQKRYSYETSAYRQVIKGACNLILTPRQALDIIGNLTPLESQILVKRFEIPEYYKQFNYAEVGVHTRTHAALGRDVSQYVQDEITTSMKHLKQLGISHTPYFVSPMSPRYGANIRELIPLLIKLNFKGILDSSQGFWNQRDYIMQRIDAKNIENIFSCPHVF